MGVFAHKAIEASEWTYIYGTVCPKRSQYGFEHSDGKWWEPFPPFRYTNHSDDPNCVVYEEEDTGAVIIEALRDIKRGEELTIDYGHAPGEGCCAESDI
jgi:hypothetical protein